MQRFSLTFEYPVAFTEDLFEPQNPVLADALARREADRRHRVAVFVDAGVAEAQPGLAQAIAAYADAHAHRMRLVAPPETVPGGEACKNDPALLARLQHRLLELAMDRHSFVMAVGGGAVLDLVGYAAATTHRGVRLLRVPTTVLAQADSGVGVKNAVNAFGVKNLLGTFVPPFAVLNDFGFLDHLAPRDRIAGMAEAVKVALIRDGGFFAWIEGRADALGRFEKETAAYLIRRCAELHLRQIATGGDPFEWGSARPLDYGHWAAHKLEALTRHELRHGEAVAIGMALDARYSVLSGLLTAGEEDRICRVLQRLGFRPWHPMLEHPLILDGLREFREHLGGELTITLLAGIGRGVEVHEMDEALIADAIGWLRQRDPGPKDRPR
ncbi:MAG: 3-dehydroquinate synthase [Alphaproteobacteria bacterium]|nr:3-dehydroquinate synthase [Alphaproteobacteria bacterium]